MVATASTEHSYWLALTQALAFLAVFVYATHATQAIAFEWKSGFSKHIPAAVGRYGAILERLDSQ